MIMDNSDSDRQKEVEESRSDHEKAFVQRKTDSQWGSATDQWLATISQRENTQRLASFHLTPHRGKDQLRDFCSPRRLVFFSLPSSRLFAIQVSTIVQSVKHYVKNRWSIRKNREGGFVRSETVAVGGYTMRWSQLRAAWIMLPMATRTARLGLWLVGRTVV